MGLDLSQLFGSAQSSAAQGMTDVLQQGANAGLGYFEGQAISVLQTDQTNNQAAVQAATTKLLNSPSSPFGQYLSNLMAQPILKQYGGYAFAGIALLIVVGVMMRD